MMSNVIRDHRLRACAAAAVALAAAGAAFVAPAWLAAALASGAGILALTGTVTVHEAPPEGYDQLVQKVSDQAHSGRRLVIYERETGLFAYWYMLMRVEEECERALRYGEPFTLAVVEPSPDAIPQIAIAEITGWMNHSVRAADSAAYAGNGRHILLMPRTGIDEAHVVVSRLRDTCPTSQTGMSVYGVDGENFEQLYAAAADRLPPTVTRRVA